MIAHMRKFAKQSKTTTQVVLEEYTLNEPPHNSLSDAKAEYLLAEKLNKNGSFKI